MIVERVNILYLKTSCIGTYRQMCVFNKMTKRRGMGSENQSILDMHRIGCNKLNRIFITHMHGDHLFGLSSVILGIGFERNHQELRNASLSIYGPVGLTEYLSTCFRTCSCKLYYPLNIYELCRKDQHCGSDDAVIVSSVVLSPSDLNYSFIHPHSLYPDENGSWECVNESFGRVFAGSLSHTITTFGYSYFEANQSGTVHAEAVLPLLKKNEAALAGRGINIYDILKRFKVEAKRSVQGRRARASCSRTAVRWIRRTARCCRKRRRGDT